MKDLDGSTEQASHALATPPLGLHQAAERMALTEFGSREKSIAVIGVMWHETHVDSPDTEQ